MVVSEMVYELECSLSDSKNKIQKIVADEILLPNDIKKTEDTILYNTACEHRQLQEDLASLEKWE